MREYYRRVVSLLGDDRRRIVPIVILFLASSFIEMIGIGMVAPFVAAIINPDLLDEMWTGFAPDLEITGSSNQLVYLLGAGLAFLFVLKTAASLITQYVIIGYANRLQLRLRKQLLNAYQSMPYGVFTQRNSAEHSNSILGLTHAFSQLVVYGLLKSVSDITIAVTIVLFLAWTNMLAMSLLVAMLLLIVLGWDYLVKGSLERIGEQTTEANVQISRGVIESIVGLKELRVLGLEKFFHTKVAAVSEEQAALQRRASLLQMTPNNLLELAMVVYVVLLVTITMALERDVVALLPTFAVFGVAAVRLLPTARNFSSMLGQIRSSKAVVDRLYEDVVWIRSSKIEQFEASDSVAEEFQSLEVRNVHFSYADELGWILNGTNLIVRKGEAIGLVGPSGAGKTTLVNVLLGLFHPQKGQILFNGRPISECMQVWRSQVAYLPQDAFIIDDTLANNIALGVDGADQDQAEIETAAKKAKLDAFAAQLPMGFSTELGERGIQISGGQRQRVVLARALYHDRTVLVLDEATSSLDLETEREIVEEIKRLKGKVTLIVIAHRLATIEHCDRIYHLEQGELRTVDAVS